MTTRKNVCCILFSLLMLSFGVCLLSQGPEIYAQAKKKLSELTADTAPTSDDLVETVNDPGGTPASRKVTLSNLSKGLGAASDTVQGVVTTGAQTFAGVKTFNSGVVVNESGADSDTRIEGDTDPNLFVVDASTNRIGIGTNAPQYKIDFDTDVGGFGIRLYGEDPSIIIENNDPADIFPSGIIFTDTGGVTGSEWRLTYLAQYGDLAITYPSWGSAPIVRFDHTTSKAVFNRPIQSPGVDLTVATLTATTDGLNFLDEMTFELYVAEMSADRTYQLSSDSADKIVTLPSTPDIGTRVTLYSGATGCEVRSPSGSNDTVNSVDCDGSNELAIPANSIIHFECRAAEIWIAVGWGSNGSALTLTPDP